MKYLISMAILSNSITIVSLVIVALIGNSNPNTSNIVLVIGGIAFNISAILITTIALRIAMNYEKKDEYIRRNR